MLAASDGWRYFDSVEQSRRVELAKYGSFDELLSDVVEDVRVVRAIAEPGRDPGLKECLQPVFFLDLPKTGDALFNGTHGYRAQYWTDPWQGLAANRMLLAFLKPKLLASVDAKDQPNLERIDICASLDAVSAKVWINEARSTLTGKRDLDVEPWVSEAGRGVELALMGVAAPPVSRFEVKGALLDVFGHERVPARKIRRHYDIHNYGFA